MKCSDYVRWMSLKLDGSLSEDRLRELARHMTTCERCRAESRLLERIGGSLGEKGPSGLSAGFTERVTERVGTKPRTERFAWRWPALIPMVASIAAVVLAFVFRAGLAGSVAPPMERLAAGMAGPVASLGRTLLDLFAASPDFFDRNITVAESVSPIPITVLAAATVACLAVGLAFYKASTLFSEQA